MNRDNESLAWLTLGHVQHMAKNDGAARQAYEKAQQTARAGSDAQKKAAQALARLQ